MSLLAALTRAGVLRSVDAALAQSLRRLDPDTPDLVLAGAALASWAVAQGHAGFRPAQAASLVDAAIEWPDGQQWLDALASSPWVATPQPGTEAPATRPLVLEHGLLYLRRYREYEQRLANQLQRIAAQGIRGDIDALAPLFARLFPPVPAPILARSAGEGRAGGKAPAVQTDDRQARAAALALRRALLLVSGGPGTGKTTTIARLLVLRVAQALQAGLPQPRIALAAPTGRAAERMAESLRRAAQQMHAAGIDAGLLQALDARASTLHRLLGVNPDVPQPRHHAGNPLPHDIVVVDEASMVDLPLMYKLAEAVADGAQLILLGDPDQLPSVEAGDVLAAIVSAAGAGDAVRGEDAHALQGLLGEVPTLAGSGGLQGHRVHLLRGWRQSDALQLGPLADAVRTQDADAALALLRGGELDGVHFHEGCEDPLEARPQLLGHWRALAQIDDPLQALQQAGRVRLLTAVREGRQGARGLNERIAAILSGRRLATPPAWFRGRLVLVRENSPVRGLFNGDVGICLPDERGNRLVWFPGPGPGEVRAFHLSALPSHESAFAMTIHKSQGSEFDEVWLQLPRNPNQVLSRELVYTGLTRARHTLHVAGSEDVLRFALSRQASRVSGLAQRLQGHALTHG